MSVTALIVDDSSVMRKIVERSLRQAGVDLGSVVEAGNGAEALSVLNTQTVDLVLSDINMPVMDGLEFVRQAHLAKLVERTPIVMITTEGGEANVREAITLGARGYIRKPFTAEAVREHVLPLLEARS